jgi:hypothetical protein
MVRSLLNCTKSQTRRIVKPQPDFISPENTPRITKAPGLHPYIPCPYGQPGDRLWVREAFRFLDSFDGNSPITVGEMCLNAGYPKPWAPTQYEADGGRDNWMNVGTAPGSITAGKLRPGIHMPRWASRILLEVTGVRVERLADISKDDAMAEGIVIQPDGGFGLADSTHYHFTDPTDSYASLWESINGAGSWFANPWVWVVSFKRVEE